MAQRKLHSEGSRKKQGETMRRLYRENKIKVTPSQLQCLEKGRGKKSEETKKKIGEANRGITRTAEQREQISQTLKRKYASGEIKIKRRKFTEEQKREISIRLKEHPLNYWKGKKRPEETIKKSSESHKELYKSGYINPNKGKHLTPEQVKRMVDGRTRSYKLDKNPAWLGGISFEPYGLEFNDELKDKIRTRYHFRCQQCFRHQEELRDKSNRKVKLNIHHIDYNKKNNSETNLILLCRNCHAQTNFKRENWTNYFKEKVGGCL